MDDDEAWLEAGFALAVAQYVNAFADALGVPLDGAEERPTLVPPLFDLPALQDLTLDSQALLGEIGEFFGGAAPNVYMALGRWEKRLAAAWDYVKGVLPDRALSRKTKTAIGFAASAAARSPYGINLHRRELLRLGIGEEGILEVLSIVQLFEAITKVADLLLMPPEIENADMKPAARTSQGGGTYGLD